MADLDISNLQTVTFRLGEELFLIDIIKIQEIIRMVNITAVPNSPDFVKGVINLRGRIVPVIDLRKQFGMPPYSGDEKDQRIIIVEIGNVLVGCTVDLIKEVLKVDETLFEKTPKIVAGLKQKFIEGIVKYKEEIYILLNVDKLLSDEERDILASAVE